MLAHIYLGIADEFSGNGVQFDTKVRNPGRILRLYGTMNRKGQNTPNRPHRQTACALPNPWQLVTERSLSQLADHYARKRNRNTLKSPKQARKAFAAAGAGDYRTLNVITWFRAHGLYRAPIGAGKHAVTCPWHQGHSTAHGRTGAVIFEPDGGWPGFYCHHASCQGRDIRDVVAVLGDADAYCTSEYRGSTGS